MSLFKNIFKKKNKLKCAVCGEAVENTFKTKYLKLNNCFGLYIIHYDCDKKVKEFEYGE